MDVWNSEIHSSGIIKTVNNKELLNKTIYCVSYQALFTIVGPMHLGLCFGFLYFLLAFLSYF